MMGFLVVVERLLCLAYGKRFCDDSYLWSDNDQYVALDIQALTCVLQTKPATGPGRLPVLPCVLAIPFVCRESYDANA